MRVVALVWNCLQYIPQHYPVAEVEQILKSLRQRLQELEIRVESSLSNLQICTFGSYFVLILVEMVA